MKISLISEAAPSDLMPASLDPYQGSARADAPAMEPPMEPPVGPEPELTEIPDNEGQDLLGADGDQELSIDDAPEAELPPPQPSPLEMADWIEQESTDRRDKTFSHKDGFHLRIRQLDSDPNRLLAQLYAREKILDKGFVNVPEGTDPSTYIQGLAEKMLNLEKGGVPKLGPEVPMPGPELGLEPSPEIGPAEFPSL